MVAAAVGHEQRMPIDQILIGQRRRALDQRKVAELAASIREVGLLNPVTLTRDARLVAGQHRLEACASLGWTRIPYRTVDADELHRELCEIDENLIRNDLSVLEQGEHLARRDEVLSLLGQRAKQGDNRFTRSKVEVNESSPLPKTTADIGADAGLSERQAQQRKQIATRIAPEVRETIRPTPVADNTAQLLTLARQTPAVQTVVADSIRYGTAADVKDALRQIKRTEQRTVPADLPRVSERFRLLHGDLWEMAQQIEPESVDAIITDPPYPVEYLPLHETLARVAARILKPGGSLAVMVGHIYLPEILAMMAPHITYQWTLAYVLGGPSVSVWSRKALVGWKPVLWFVKGSYTGELVSDVCKSDRAEKQHHEWGQSESGFDELLYRFTRPGDVVCDPFVGGGTCAVVALQQNRLFIGIDVDEQAIQTTAARIAALDAQEGTAGGS